MLFRVAVVVAVASAGVSWQAAGTEFALLAGGGVLAGGVVAGVVALIRRRTEDPVLETVIALVTPYAAYVLAEEVHASGVTSVVVAGVVLGGQAGRFTNARIRIQLHAVNGTVVFLLESVVFSLIGLTLLGQVAALTDADRLWPLYALVVAATLIAVRLLWVLPLSVIVERSAGTRPSWRVPAVLTWAGTRGVVPLAAALSIPAAADDGSLLGQRPLVLVLTTSVVVVTMVPRASPWPMWSAAPASPSNRTTPNARRHPPGAALPPPGSAAWTRCPTSKPYRTSWRTVCDAACRPASTMPATAWMKPTWRSPQTMSTGCCAAT
ncbi:hypothetical protein GCM10010343_39450 [Streptomyces avidinii]|uniref:NhaP-type Na+/H+ or K+/H+ antiporter n=1 Tax=Streptomyces avidinii TaxID=1895 RepID=A0ABS4L6I9_STRAV|nr:NhaP-type Na+/H+ or K+/H+ antiporter [Streptomyces avidinii]GGZ09189.1 hypothetical protein GCM10010343_39450 [Streptomyces avidinii]